MSERRKHLVLVGLILAALVGVALLAIPGSPAFVGKAENYKVTAPEHGFQIDLHDHNAVQGSFRFAA